MPQLETMAAPKLKRTITEKHVRASANLKRIWQDRKQVDKSLTQEKIAERLDGITQGAVSQYMNATMALNAEAILKFAVLFDVSPDDIWPDFYEDFAGGKEPATHIVQDRSEKYTISAHNLSDEDRMEIAVEFVEEMLGSVAHKVSTKTKAGLINEAYKSIRPDGSIDVKHISKLIISKLGTE